MRRRPSLPALIALLGLVCELLASGCSACTDRRFVAELLSAEARVERDFERAPLVFLPAEPGARFSMGDGLRTGPTASATLALKRGGRVLVKSNTIMRFVRSLTHDLDVEVAGGELTVETGEVDLGIRTARGLVKLASGSVVKVSAQPDKIHFDVAVGRAERETGSTPLGAKAGASFDVELLPVSVERAQADAPSVPQLDAAVAQRADAAVAQRPDAALAQPAASERETPSGPTLLALAFKASPPDASVTLRAGESVTIHDPAAATDVRMLVTHCAADAVWEFDAGNGRYDALRVHGTGELRARVPLGSYRHRVRCVRDGRLAAPAHSSGRLQVLRDAAVRPLPIKPATITADADGRRYTVSYQNRLPIITLRWPDAPKAAGYTLRVTPEHGAAFSVEAKHPSVTLPGERFGEGQHQFTFEAGGLHSEPGLLGVTFDYRARTAYLTSPIDGQRVSTRADGVHFAGGTLLGSHVSVQGVPLQLDGKGRFSGDVALPAPATSVAVRVVHPTTGIHYYIRHLPAAAAP